MSRAGGITNATGPNGGASVIKVYELCDMGYALGPSMQALIEWAEMRRKRAEDNAYCETGSSGAPARSPAITKS